MSKKEKQGLMDVSVKTVKTVLCFSLVFIALIYVLFGIMERTKGLAIDPVRYVEGWTVIGRDGEEFPAGRGNVSGGESYQNATIYATLPNDVRDQEYLYFDTRNDVAVYVNGELRKDFVEKRDVNVPGGLIKKFYLMVPLKDSDSEAEVTVAIGSNVKDDEILPEAFVSTRYGAFSHFMRNAGLSFFLASIVLIFSIVVIIVSVVLRFWYKMSIYMAYGALGIFVIASWIVTDSVLFPFIFGAEYVDGILNYMFCFIIPFAPAIYLNALQKGRYQKSMSVIMLVTSLNAILWPLLHFTGVLPFYHIRTIVNVLLVLMAVAAIVLLLHDALKGRNGEYRYTFIGFLGFLICCLVELLNILSVKINDSSIPMVTGLGWLLTFVVIQQVEDLRKISVERQRAIDVSEAKTRFLASMSHEIRTPINAILGMNEMILRENHDRTIGEYARNVKSSGKMLLMLVNDVLDFSKIEAGKLEIHENSFHLSEVLRDVLSLIRERIGEKPLELQTEVAGDVPDELISDEFRIRQILINFLNNAVKYTEKGMITLRIGGSYAGDGYELELSVKDTGRGIRKEDQAHLFEAFSRVDAKANANIEGTGLGLAIVKSIVDSMKGSVGVESEYGVGSLFWVKLPVRYGKKDPLQKDFLEREVSYDAEAEQEGFTAPEAKILAVDDNQSNLTIVKLFLKRTGIQLDLCSTGTRAMELCREKQYDLLLLDHMMPAPDGIETLRGIRADEASLNRETKAVVLTANAVAGSRQTYLDAGFEEYLTKPLDSKALERTVKSMLPKEKVIETATMKTTPAQSDVTPLKQRLTAVKGLDYDAALSYCGGDEEFLGEIVMTMASDCTSRSERMRKQLAAKDWKAYAIDAHTLKSNMATIGMKALSERARKHEFAAKEGNEAFLLEDAEDFISEYVETCKKLSN